MQLKREDPDYCFLTVECKRKLYDAGIFENIVKEAIYMASSLFRNPYEIGKAEGKMEGKLEGKMEGKTDMVVKLLSKKFGILLCDIKKKISEAEQYQLDLIAEGIFDH